MITAILSSDIAKRNYIYFYPREVEKKQLRLLAASLSSEQTDGSIDYKEGIGVSKNTVHRGRD